MAKRSLKQIIELSANPHYKLTDDDLEVIANESRRQAKVSKKDLDSEDYKEKAKSKKNKNRFDKTAGTFEKTITEE